VFISTSINSGSTPASLVNRHYRSHWHNNNNHSVHNETKRNKRALTSENIWSKIEEDFTPELLQEHYNIPDTVQQSPKQTSMRMIADADDTSTAADDTSTADGSIGRRHNIPPKKLSALFIKPETDVECLYRKSGIREKCEVCASDVVLTDDGFLTCKNSACSILYKDESLDQSAEWRYYGADDNQNSDPTRCGMPVNPDSKPGVVGII